MKRFIISLVGALFLVVLPAMSKRTAEIRIGDTLPGFSVISDNGDTVSVKSLKNKPAIIVFFHTRCYDCRKELPVIQQMYQIYGKQIQFICISRAESEQTIAEYWKRNHFTLPYSAQSDKKVFKLFAERTIPRIYVVDRESIVRKTFRERVRKRKLVKAIENQIQLNNSK